MASKTLTTLLVIFFITSTQSRNLRDFNSLQEWEMDQDELAGKPSEGDKINEIVYDPAIDNLRRVLRQDIVQSGDDVYVQADGSQTEGEKNPGWVRRNWRKLKNITTSVVNMFGNSSLQAADIVENLCHILKGLVPKLEYVCSVKEFQFCSSLRLRSKHHPESGRVDTTFEEPLMPLDNGRL